MIPVEIIAETQNGKAPFNRSIALHIVAVRRMFSDGPGDRPHTGQSSDPSAVCPFASVYACYIPKVLLRTAPLSSFNFGIRLAPLFGVGNSFFTFRLIALKF